MKSSAAEAPRRNQGEDHERASGIRRQSAVRTRGAAGDTDRPLLPLTIDHKEITIPSGTTILQAARQAGIRIPTLCHHDDLCVAGVCRLCVVEVEGQRMLQRPAPFR
jgi:ferredoxin